MHLFPGYILWKYIYRIKNIANSEALPIIYRKEDYFNNC